MTTNPQTAVDRIRTYLRLLPTARTLGGEIAYSEEFRSEDWPRSCYAPTREDVEALLAAVSPPPAADRAAVLLEAEDDEGDELVCVDMCGSCDACGMEPFGTPAEGWREAARFLRRTARDSGDRQGALHGARLIEAELRRLAVEAQQQRDTETPFATRVLEIFAKADTHGDLLWRIVDGQPEFAANVSDVFAWGGADAEDITAETLLVLEQAFADLAAIRSTEFVADLYAARLRKMRPQGAAYPGETHPSWREVSALFDACGPERELGLGNPKPAPAHRASDAPAASGPRAADDMQDEADEVIHACPPDGSGLTPCCGRTPFDLPLTDRISSEVPVTCPGAVVSQPGKET